MGAAAVVDGKGDNVGRWERRRRRWMGGATVVGEWSDGGGGWGGGGGWRARGAGRVGVAGRVKREYFGKTGEKFWDVRAQKLSGSERKKYFALGKTHCLHFRCQRTTYSDTLPV